MWMCLFFVNTIVPDADCYCGIQRKYQSVGSANMELLETKKVLK